MIWYTSILVCILLNDRICNGDINNSDENKPLNASYSKFPLYKPEIHKACSCGCNLTADEGEVIATGRCTGLSTWRISVQSGYQIELVFSYQLYYGDKQWIKVRDGGSSESPVVLFSGGSRHASHVTSSTNQILVEFFTNESADSTFGFPWKATRRVHLHGFILRYSMIIDPLKVVEARLNQVEAALNQKLEEMNVRLSSCTCGGTKGKSINSVAPAQGSTEKSPTTKEGGFKCTDDQFHCNETWQCISKAWVCDGERDCTNGEDERDCNTADNVVCDEGFIKCDTRLQCIHESWVCDGDIDCDDGSDEGENCP